ncbi:MAG: IS5 family transposase, partial [Deltaproteobacteria bacterium]|nr:IS5 family transposase [Deltaproteobacteria bacterium]
DVPQPTSSHEGPLHLIVDSTGLKIFGAGEWNSRKHRKAKDRRGWRKLHLGVDEEGFIVAQALTKSTGDDAAMLPELLSQVDDPVKRFTGDGAYDRRATYEQIGEAGTDDVVIVVPPRRPATKSAAAEGPWAQRDRHVEMIEEVGRQAWQELVGYRQQARVEGTFLRYKRTLGCALQARGFEAQAKESMIGSNILNRMLELGRPDSVAVTGWPVTKSATERPPGHSCNNASLRARRRTP